MVFWPPIPMECWSLFGKLNPQSMVFWSLPMVYRTPYPWYINLLIHGILSPYPWNFDPIPLVYWTPCPWYFDSLSMVFPPNHGISKPLPMPFWPPTHGNLTPIHGIWTPYPWPFDPLPMVFCLPYPCMVFWPPYPWYFDPLSMVFWPLYPLYISPPTHGISTRSYAVMNPSLLVELRGVNLPWGQIPYDTGFVYYKKGVLDSQPQVISLPVANHTPVSA